MGKERQEVKYVN